MRTTLDLPESLLSEAMRVTHTETKTAVIVLTLEELIQKSKSMELSNEEKAEVEDARKILNQITSYPSIYVHNYDLITTVLNEKKKKLKNFVK